MNDPVLRIQPPRWTPAEYFLQLWAAGQFRGPMPMDLANVPLPPDIQYTIDADLDLNEWHAVARWGGGQDFRLGRHDTLDAAVAACEAHWTEYKAQQTAKWAARVRRAWRLAPESDLARFNHELETYRDRPRETETYRIARDSPDPDAVTENPRQYVEM